MRERVREIVSEIDENLPPVEDEDPEEARAFLEWIADDNFTFLGYREYDLLTEDGEDLLRSVPGRSRHPAGDGPEAPLAQLRQAAARSSSSPRPTSSP